MRFPPLPKTAHEGERLLRKHLPGIGGLHQQIAELLLPQEAPDEPEQPPAPLKPSEVIMRNAREECRPYESVDRAGPITRALLAWLDEQEAKPKTLQLMPGRVTWTADQCHVDRLMAQLDKLAPGSVGRCRIQVTCEMIERLVYERDTLYADILKLEQQLAEAKEAAAIEGRKDGKRIRELEQQVAEYENRPPQPGDTVRILEIDRDLDEDPNPKHAVGTTHVVEHWEPSSNGSGLLNHPLNNSHKSRGTYCRVAIVKRAGAK